MKISITLKILMIGWLYLGTGIAEAKVIYHAHDMKFTEIVKRLIDLKRLGFSHIQVSPPQKSRDTLPGHSHGKNGEEKRWWLHYQPEEYKIDDTFGNEEDFKKLVKEANNQGVEIIVDLIITHMRAPDGVEAHDFKPEIVKAGIAKCTNQTNGWIEIIDDVRGNYEQVQSTKVYTDEELQKLTAQTISNDCKKSQALNPSYGLGKKKSLDIEGFEGLSW